MTTLSKTDIQNILSQLPRIEENYEVRGELTHKVKFDAGTTITFYWSEADRDWLTDDFLK